MEEPGRKNLDGSGELMNTMKLVSEGIGRTQPSLPELQSRMACHDRLPLRAAVPRSRLIG